MQNDLSRIYWPGEVLCQEGDPGTEMFFIQQGLVKVSRMINGEEVVLAELGDSSVVGEMAVIDQAPRSATVVALEPTTVLPMSPRKLRYIFQHAPDVAVSIVKLLSLKLRESNDKIGRGFILHDWVFWRRTIYLLTLLATAGDPQAEHVQLPDEGTRTNLAVGLGLSLTETHQVLDRLTSAKLIEPTTDSSDAPYFSLEMTELNMFYTFLDRYFGSSEKGVSTGMPPDTYMVASKLLELSRRHYGRLELAASTFQRGALLDFIATAPDVFAGNSQDMRRKRIDRQLANLEKLGFMSGEKSLEGAVTLDLVKMAQHIEEEEYIRSCLARYRILTAS